jgi:hypothetical protein
MTKEMKTQLKIAEVNAKVGIAVGVLFIASILMYLAFFK